MNLIVEVYRLTERFPRAETYRLTDQVTRAAASVPANIAEGHSRSTRKDYAHFLSIAKGSLMETETFVLVAVRLGYVSEPAAQPALSLISELERMLAVLRKRLTG